MNNQNRVTLLHKIEKTTLPIPPDPINHNTNYQEPSRPHVQPLHIIKDILNDIMPKIPATKPSDVKYPPPRPTPKDRDTDDIRKELQNIESNLQHEEALEKEELARKKNAIRSNPKDGDADSIREKLQKIELDRKREEAFLEYNGGHPAVQKDRPGHNDRSQDTDNIKKERQEVELNRQESPGHSALNRESFSYGYEDETLLGEEQRAESWV